MDYPILIHIAVDSRQGRIGREEDAEKQGDQKKVAHKTPVKELKLVKKLTQSPIYVNFIYLRSNRMELKSPQK